MSGFVIVSVSSSRRLNRLKGGVNRLQFLHRRLELTSNTLRGSSGEDWQDGAWCQYICCMFCDNRTMRGRIGSVRVQTCRHRVRRAGIRITCPCRDIPVFFSDAPKIIVEANLHERIHVFFRLHLTGYVGELRGTYRQRQSVGTRYRGLMTPEMASARFHDFVAAHPTFARSLAVRTRNRSSYPGPRLRVSSLLVSMRNLYSISSYQQW